MAHWKLNIAVLIASMFQFQVLADEVETLGFESAEPGPIAAPWFVPSEGWNADLCDEQAADGRMSCKLHLPGTSAAPFGNLMRTLDASKYRNTRVRLAAKVIVQGTGRSQMWLRVDREDGSMGAFDNMDDRPIIPGGWQDAIIEADVDSNARLLNIGFMAIDGATVFIDSVTLAVVGIAAEPQAPSPARPLSERALENEIAATRLLAYVRFFHPSDQAVGVGAWDHFAVDLIDRVETAEDPKELAKRLREMFQPIAPTLEIWDGTLEQAPNDLPPPKNAVGWCVWEHQGAGDLSTVPSRYTSTVRRQSVWPTFFSSDKVPTKVVKNLGGGVCCRLPIKVYRDMSGTIPHGSTPEKWSSAAGKPKLTALNRSTRLAGVAIAWGILQHFYPYFDTVDTDWEAALVNAMRKAADDTNEIEYLATLREMISLLHDGHGSVGLVVQGTKATYLPLALQWIGSDFVVVGMQASVTEQVEIGDVVTSIDGVPMESVYAMASKWVSSATEGWRRTVAVHRILADVPTPNPVTIELRKPDGSKYSTQLIRTGEYPKDQVRLRRPANGTDLGTGIIYFDLCGTETEALTELLPTLAKAKGIVFDMRGYPGSAAFELMKHLIDSPATSARWLIPRVPLPDREALGWIEAQRWDLRPSAPRLTAEVVFLTDSRAISYAESIMGIVEHYKFGEIIGGTTAGTNGNVNPFQLPGGYQVSWTGMKVLKHDGSQHHGVGIRPTVPVAPTARRIAEGRDEVLEKAVDWFASGNDK